VDPGLNILLFLFIVVIPCLIVWAVLDLMQDRRVKREHIVYANILREYWLYEARSDGRVSWQQAKENSKGVQQRLKRLEDAKNNNKSIVWQHGKCKRLNLLSLHRYPEPFLPSKYLRDPHCYDRWVK